MTAHLLNPYQVDHLFLLVGENPMPNYVAGKLLTHSGATLYLIYSTGTEPQYRNLKTLLANAFKIQPIPLGKDESDPFEIEDKLKPYLAKIPSSESIGLHYTGGRKVMAVHAYRTLRWWEHEQNQPIIFSYLNANTLSLQIDAYNNRRCIPISIARAIEPLLTDILRLHSIKWHPHKPPRSDVQGSELTATLAEIVSQERIVSQETPENKKKSDWAQWLDIFRERTKKPLQALGKSNISPKEKQNLEEELRKQKIPLAQAPLEFREAARHHLAASTEVIDLNISTKQGNFASAEELCRWLDGTWLEDYVMTQIQPLCDQYNLRELCRSLHIQDGQNTWRKTDQFEFDVVFLHGYQLFGISCTTTFDHKLCKQKLFEAYLRAQQMGGDEVRTALVCTHDNPDWLRQELNLDRDPRHRDPKIQVFGRKDLLNLQTKIALWIKDNTPSHSR
jgi:hypothetical protein